MDKGDKVLIPFPFTDLKGQKKRPAIVLSINDSDVTVAFITTRFKWYAEFDIKLEPSKKNGLKKTSLIRLNKIATIDKELVDGLIGNLNNQKIEELNYNLKKLFKL